MTMTGTAMITGRHTVLHTLTSAAVRGPPLKREAFDNAELVAVPSAAGQKQ